MPTETTLPLLGLRTDTFASTPVERYENTSSSVALHTASHPTRADSFNGNSGTGLLMRSTSSKRPQLLQTLSDASDASQETLSSVRPLPRNGLERSGSGGQSRLARDESGWHMRHGWDSQYSAEQLRELSTNFYMYFNDKRHETGGRPKEDAKGGSMQEWRMKDRLKTVSAALAVCLNIGVDPPDVIKTNPCAKLECWLDPQASQLPGQTSMNAIGKALQIQYEQLSMRTRYKVILDPTNDEIKKYCTTLRKNAKDERILFHYNGHGVPKPTPSGEIWFFNKNYTQYIPISLGDLQSWLGAPTLFVYDCSEAGLIIRNFNKLVEKQDAENAEALRKDPTIQISNFHECIHLAACREGESLPTNPNLPADVFTSCLTTPIDMAVKFFIMRNPLPNNLQVDDFSKITGRSQERRTPIGELNWIFTAITDTIAWNSLPKPLFKKLFRQDLMVAALFRNFLLAQRIMRHYHCSPQCYPEIPSTHNHPLWNSWDLAVEMVLAQIPQLHNKEIEYEYQHSEFFSEQLTAFEVYLTQGAVEQKEPEQLPIVLQVLLSQVHRLRALILLSKFLDLGPWAVNLALGIGIFPYVLKLLQSQAVELKPVMVFIWARILAVDQDCQNDLIKDNGYQYFISILNPVTGMPIREVTEHRAMCAFIIAMFCKDFKQAQTVAHSPDLVESCLSQTLWPDVENPMLRQWSCLCLSMLWKDYPEAKWSGIRASAHLRLVEMTYDPVPEVRAAMLHALTNFLGIPELTDQVAQIEEGITSRILLMNNDGSSLVRQELVIYLSAFAVRHKSRFVVAAYEQMLEEKEQLTRIDDKTNPPTPGANGSFEGASTTITGDTVFSSAWKHLMIMSIDADPQLAHDASLVVDFILEALVASPLAEFAKPLMEEVLKHDQQPMYPLAELNENLRQQAQVPASPALPSAVKGGDGYFSIGIRRTASVAASLKNLAFGGGISSYENLQDLRTPAAARPSNIDRANTTRAPVAADWPRPVEERSQVNQAPYRQAKYPPLKRLKLRNVDGKATLPLKSAFFDWSMEYFREPQMKQNEADEPGSTDYNQRLWRRNRNEKILATTQKMKDHAGSSRWDTASGFFDNGFQPMRLCFHQYDNHLAVTDNHDTVRIWDWERQKALSRFSNGNPTRSTITGTRFINEDDQALLMTGSSDGVIKLFRDYESSSKVHMVSSFRALVDLVPSTHNAGLVFDWLQGRGWALVAGDAKVIRVWNAATELCLNDIPARSGSCVTSLTSDQVEGNIFVAGFGDGAIRVYDQREKPTQSRVQQWKEHTQWVTSVHMQRGGQRELVSACRGGEVKLWDIRMGKSLRTISATKDNLRSLSVHEHAPVFATGSERHNIKVFNMDGTPLSSFNPYSTFLQHSRSAPIAVTAFHPHRMMLACAALNDSHINLFSCVDGNVQPVHDTRMAS